MDGGHEAQDRLSMLESLGFERADSVSYDSETFRLGRDTCETRSTAHAMGTRVTVVSMDGSPERTGEASGRALEEMERLVSILSRYDSGSAVTYLNDTGVVHNPPPELVHVLRRADLFHRITRGLFDVTVAPLVDLFRASHGAPMSDDLADARALVGHRHLKVTERTLRFDRSGMRVTLDGIAKGYVVDGMAEILREYGIHDFLIEAGGDVRAAGSNPEGGPWKIGVRNPLTAGAFEDAIGLGDAAVATSGGYENSFGPTGRFHHIVDARVASSPRRCASMSVVAPTAMGADAMATAAFIMGPGRAVRLIDRLPGWACFVIDTNGNTFASRRWNADQE